MLIYGTVKQGDIVICVDDDVDYGELTLGKSYEIDLIHPYKENDDEEWIKITGEKGQWWYYPRHFSLSKDLIPVEEGWTL